MEDTDWRPSPCPGCGKMRDAARHPVCENTNCEFYHLKVQSHYQAEKERTMKTEKQYLWVKEDRAPMFVTDLIALYKDRDIDPNKDKIYEIGPEVKIELNVKVIPAHPVYRGSSYAEGTR